MKISGATALVTGGASGLGRATAEALVARGANVVIVDLLQSVGEDVAAAIGAHFAAADVTDETQMRAAFDVADALGPLRAVVHCAGRGATLRILDREGVAGELETFEAIVRTNLIGSFRYLMRHTRQVLPE